ncbi:hypothetical protein PYCC9005_002928 [Savitreella phatthalungensis]
MGKKTKTTGNSRPVQSSITFPAFAPHAAYEPPASSVVVLNDQLVLLPDLLSVRSRETFLRWFVEVARPPGKGEATRTNARFSVDDPEFARRLFEDGGVRERCDEIECVRESAGKRLVGLNSNIRVYRYPQGTYFGPHYDESVASTVLVGGDGEGERLIRAQSRWTLLIYLLEGEVQGGETSFDVPSDEATSISREYLLETDDLLRKNGAARSRVVKVAPKLAGGMALLHKHGNDCLLHEGRVVRSGVKWVLRTDLMYI